MHVSRNKVLSGVRESPSHIRPPLLMTKPSESLLRHEKKNTAHDFRKNESRITIFEQKKTGNV